MIKEYIKNLLEENEQDLAKLEKQMKDSLEELSCAEKWLESLQIKSNSQTNIFSPRNQDTDLELKVEKASASIQKINKEIEYVRDLIETHLKKKSEYEKLFSEISDSEKNVDNLQKSIEENKPLKHSSLSAILSDLYSRTEVCLAFLNGNKNRCKKELNEMKTIIKKYAEETEIE